VQTFHAVNKVGNAPLHYATLSGSHTLAIVQYLVESCGTNTLAVNDIGHTPLRHASTKAG
jgi:ankyrin repeat protein